MAARSAPQVALVCFSLVDTGLAVLVPASGSAREASWPTAPLPSESAPHDVADALAKRVLQRAPAWRAQVGAFAAGDALVIAYVAVVAAGTSAPSGFVWQSLPRGAGHSVLRACVSHLRDRLDREPVAFRLLAPLFTLSELQQVYELLLERRLHKASFRRTLLAAHVVEPTDSWRSEGRGRPAQLFRYSPRRRRGVQRAVRFELLG